MRVLHVEAGRHLYGGARQVAWLLEGLAERDVDNLLACPEGAAVAEEGRRAGARVVEMPMKGDLDLALVGRLRRLIRAQGVELVHVHSRRGADILGGIAARLEGVPCVLSRRVDNPERAWVARLKYRLFDRVITISEGIREVLLAEGVEPGRVVCVRSALDAAPFDRDCDRDRLEGELGIAGDGPLLGVVAQLIPRKGHRHLLAALPALVERHPGLRVVFFGRGGHEAALRREVEERGLGGAVVFAGFRRDLARFLPCLDLLVHPADMEGLGIALLQAQAAGVPVVASRAGGIPEAVADGETGLLVAPGDVAGLEAAVARLLADEPGRLAMGRRGRERIREAFSIDTMVIGNLAVYREVLEAGR